MNPIRNSNQPDNYRALVLKLIQLAKVSGVAEKPTVDEIHHTEAQNRLKEHTTPPKKSTAQMQRRYKIYKIKVTLISNPFTKNRDLSDIPPCQNIMERLRHQVIILVQQVDKDLRGHPQRPSHSLANTTTLKTI